MYKRQVPEQGQQGPDGQPHRGGVVIGMNADAAAVEIPVQAEADSVVPVVQQPQRRHGAGGQVQQPQQLLRGGEAQAAGAVAALELLQVTRLLQRTVIR